ncbi:hypothetical protein L1887_40521 [Cichorium endivia]|nr:hypothetical protein L1887_40521 [Cichorium endivia]
MMVFGRCDAEQGCCSCPAQCESAPHGQHARAMLALSSQNWHARLPQARSSLWGRSVGSGRTCSGRAEPSGKASHASLKFRGVCAGPLIPATAASAGQLAANRFRVRRPDPSPQAHNRGRRSRKKCERKLEEKREALSRCPAPRGGGVLLQSLKVGEWP